MEEKNTTVKKESVPIWEKYALTIYEAAEYFNIWRASFKAVGKREPSGGFCAMDWHKG